MKEDLKFINEYHNKLKGISQNICDNLPKVNNDKKISKHLSVIQYKDLTDWDISNIKRNKNLLALSNKIDHMIFTGKAHSIIPMLEKIVTGRVKKLYQPGIHTKKESLGIGSFRWNSSAITLSKEEINKVKSFFELS